MNILSIHRCLAYGSPGNPSAVFPMQRLARESDRFPFTVQNSPIHTGYGELELTLLRRPAIEELVDGIAGARCSRRVRRHSVGLYGLVRYRQRDPLDVGGSARPISATLYGLRSGVGDVGGRSSCRPVSRKFMRDNACLRQI